MYRVFYYNNISYSNVTTTLLEVNTEKEALNHCIAFNQDGGYEGDFGERYPVDYEEVQ